LGVATLKIKGFKYTLGGIVPGQRQLFSDSEKKSLRIRISPPMPILDIKMHAIPDALLSGETVRSVIQITNNGFKNVGSLAVKLSHPSLMLLGNPDQVECPPYGT
jgi:hypothetical protein